MNAIGYELRIHAYIRSHLKQKKKKSLWLWVSSIRHVLLNHRERRRFQIKKYI